ncbi:hypothetical protein ccbrp13_46360 [Ktedonobacteria bacterium brp13]|nr:hypothetical protein ccbrp13_46360 [Ktedonobacteria bacterium brp13]
MLIPVGLIAVAVVALLAAFFLSRGGGDGERAGERAADIMPENQTIATPTTAIPTRPTNSTRPLETMTEEVPAIQTTPATDPATEDNDDSATDTTITTLNRELYEMADQLSTLQRHSRDMEQRLTHLSGIIEHLATPILPYPRQPEPSVEDYELAHDE